MMHNIKLALENYANQVSERTKLAEKVEHLEKENSAKQERINELETSKDDIDETAFENPRPKKLRCNFKDSCYTNGGLENKTDTDSRFEKAKMLYGNKSEMSDNEQLALESNSLKDNDSELIRKYDKQANESNEFVEKLEYLGKKNSTEQNRIFELETCRKDVNEAVYMYEKPRPKNLRCNFMTTETESRVESGKECDKKLLNVAVILAQAPIDTEIGILLFISSDKNSNEKNL